MNSEDKQKWLYALGGIALGFALSKLASKTTCKSSSEVKEEKKDDGLKMYKAQTFSKQKLENLKKADALFEKGLANKGGIPISRVPHLAEIHECQVHISPLLGDASKRNILGGERGGFLPDDAFSSCHKFILAGKSYQSYNDIVKELKFLRAGPRKKIFFDPTQVKAAIVTCGGLCPGLNVVIRELVMCLWYNYGVREIFGVKWGYRGFHKDEYIVPLDPQKVKTIHNLGGTILGSSRGGFDHKVIIDACKARGINQLYIIGGDGTHKGIYNLYEYATEQNE